MLPVNVSYCYVEQNHSSLSCDGNLGGGRECEQEVLEQFPAGYSYRSLRVFVLLYKTVYNVRTILSNFSCQIVLQFDLLLNIRRHCIINWFTSVLQHMVSSKKRNRKL